MTRDQTDQSEVIFGLDQNPPFCRDLQPNQVFTSINQKRAAFIQTTQDSSHLTTEKMAIHIKTSCDQEIQAITSRLDRQPHNPVRDFTTLHPADFNSLFTSTATVTAVKRCCWVRDGSESPAERECDSCSWFMVMTAALTVPTVDLSLC